MKANSFQHDMLGETVGTFILVFFGCGVVMVNVLFSAHTGLFQVAAVWGIGVTLAIYATRHLSCAHLNPAVTIAMVVGGRMRPAPWVSHRICDGTDYRRHHCRHRFHAYNRADDDDKKQ